jgi:transcriptional regulator with XRE-family HTH domain
MAEKDVPEEVPEYLKKLGENLKKFREARGLSLRKMAASSGTDHSALGKIESDGGNITMTTLIKLAKVLKVQPRDLLDFDIVFDN